MKVKILKKYDDGAYEWTEGNDGQDVITDYFEHNLYDLSDNLKLVLNENKLNEYKNSFNNDDITNIKLAISDIYNIINENIPNNDVIREKPSFLVDIEESIKDVSRTKV